MPIDIPTILIIVLSDSDIQMLKPPQNCQFPSSATEIKNKRIRQLLGKTQPFESLNNDYAYATMFYSRFGATPESRNIRFIRLKDLIVYLEYLESSDVHWHITRGLPIECQIRSDVISISSMHKGTKGYFQEYHLYGYNDQGYFNRVMTEKIEM